MIARSGVVITSPCLLHYVMRSYTVAWAKFMTACLLARGERNRHVSFQQNASVSSRRCQRTFQGIWR